MRAQPRSKLTLTRFPLALALAALAAQCGAPGLDAEAHSGAAPGVHLAAYRSFVWGEPTGFQDPAVVERVRAAVERELTAKGYERADAATADWTVHAHGAYREDIVVEPVYYAGATPNSPGYFQTEPHTIHRGALLIELRAGSSSRVLWRGWIEGVLDDIEHARAVVDEAVVRIFAQLPAREIPAPR